MNWTEYDVTLTEDDLTEARCGGITHPVLLRLSPASPAAQAIFQAVHGKPMSNRAWLPSDVEAVTEVLSVEGAMFLLVEHLQERGKAIVQAMKDFQASQHGGKIWWVIDIRSDGTTHETHIVRDTGETRDATKMITIDCGKGGVFTMNDDPMVITVWFVSVLHRSERKRQEVIHSIVMAFLQRLEQWPDCVATVLDVMHQRKGEEVIRRVLKTEERFQRLARHVESVRAGGKSLPACPPDERQEQTVVETEQDGVYEGE